MKETYIDNYKEKLEHLKRYVKENTSGTSRNCVEVFQAQVEEAKSLISEIMVDGENLGEVMIRTLSKDLSRYYDSFESYQRALSEMTSDSLKTLRRKILNDSRDFFKETWGEESNEFFRSKKFFSTYIKDLSLVSRLGSSLDCIITSLRRYILARYGGKK